MKHYKSLLHLSNPGLVCEMDYQELLQQLFAGTESHRKRKLELDKQKRLALKSNDSQKLKDVVHSQLRLISRISEGNNNTLRTLRIRLFVLRFVQKRLVVELRQVEDAFVEFDVWLCQYGSVLVKKSLADEKKSMKTLALLLKKFSKLIAVYQQHLKRETDTRWKSCFVQGILMLQLIIGMFKKIRPVAYDAIIFSAKNRYNPLNILFPFRFL